VEAVGIEISAFPLTWHIAYTTACCYHTSRDWLYLDLCNRYYMQDFCVNKKISDNGPSNVANRIFPRATLVAMATKFRTKLAIAWLMYAIFAKFFV